MYRRLEGYHLASKDINKCFPGEVVRAAAPAAAPAAATTAATTRGHDSRGNESPEGQLRVDSERLLPNPNYPQVKGQYLNDVRTEGRGGGYPMHDKHY